MRWRDILKRLAMVLLAMVAIVIVNIGALGIFLYSKGLSLSNIASYLWFLIMLEGLLIALMGCFMIMQIGGFTGGASGGRGIPGRYYIPPERRKKSSLYAYYLIAVGVLLFVSSWIVIILASE